MIADIFVTAAPALLAAMGALCTEYAGIMAVFLEGIINLSAFFCFAAAAVTGNICAGIAAAAVSAAVFIWLVSLFTEKTGANPFITGLAVNLFSAGITSVFSSVWFGTRGIVSVQNLTSSAEFAIHSAVFEELGVFFPRYGTSIAAWSIAFCVIIFISYSRRGLRLRITGSNPEVLRSHGVSPRKYRIGSWVIAAILASFAGSILVIRLQAFVPNISSGRGWTAIAAVFLGNRKPVGVVIAVLIFSIAEWGANALQGTLPVPASLLLALPYITALIWFLLPVNNIFRCK